MIAERCEKIIKLACLWILTFSDTCPPTTAMILQPFALGCVEELLADQPGALDFFLRAVGNINEIAQAHSRPQIRDG